MDGKPIHRNTLNQDSQNFTKAFGYIKDLDTTLEKYNFRA